MRFGNTQQRKDNMTIEILEPEVVKTKICEVEKQSGICDDAAVQLRSEFAGHYENIIQWREIAGQVSDPENPAHQKMARESRLGLKKVRCEVENQRKRLKADSLAYGKAIDGMANILKYLCEPVEAKLLEIEQYEERKEAARIAALELERSNKISEQGLDPSVYNLGKMDDDTFANLLATATQQRIEREEAERKAEAERIAKEKAEAEERQRIRAENERLKKEAAEREAALAKEREESERKIKAERDAREKMEREAEEAKRKEQDRVDAEKEAERKAAAAPDKEKLIAFAGWLRGVDVPHGSTDEGARIMLEAEKRISALASWISSEAEKL
jgi:DNA repair exonuclease SbcCD ATPase subunit